MAEKTTSTPLDRLTLEEWRAVWGTAIGITYANEPTLVQTEIDRFINEAHDYVSKRHAHEPWAVRSGTITLVASTTSYAFPADFRTLVSITEAPSSGTTRPQVTTREDFFNARQGADWTDSQNQPKWFYEYTDDSEPPVFYWRRYPTPNAAGTATILYRPYFSLLEATGGGSGRFTILPATHVPAIRAKFFSEFHAYKGDHDKSQFWRAKLEDEIDATKIADDVTSEDPIQQGFDNQFRRQFG